jgi:hypothetical protein
LVDHLETSLKEQMSTLLSPAHLLLCDKSPAEDMIDRGLDEGGGDDFPMTILM